MLLYVILASSLVGAISLVSIIVILQKESVLQKNLKSLIGIASGVLLASVFLELLPSVFEENGYNVVDPHTFFLTMLLSIMGFYLVERFIHWHHCHGTNCPSESRAHLAVTNLLGDGVHNFIDGLLIGTAFLISPAIGIATTIAIIAHEIPQEITDAGILLYAGMSKVKVVLFNFLFALTSVIGAVIAYIYIERFEPLIPLFVAVATGNFIYLALADLIPELHHEQDAKKVAKHTLWLFIGVGVFWIINQLFEHSH